MHSQSCQHICSQCSVSGHISTSARRQTRPQSCQHVHMQANSRSMHLVHASKCIPSHTSMSACNANVSLATPVCLHTMKMCPWPCQCVCRQADVSLVTFSTPASRPTCLPLWYCFFSICFVSLTICPQPHQRVCTQANASAFKQICPWPHQHKSFFCFFRSTNHLFSSSLTLPPSSIYII